MSKKRINQNSEEFNVSPVRKRATPLICTENQGEPLRSILLPMPVTPNPIDVSDKQMLSNASFNKAIADENRTCMKTFGLLNNYEHSETFLKKHSAILCEDAVHYLAVWCISLEAGKKLVTRSHVAHQCVSIHHILELAKQLKTEPKDCISFFYERLNQKDGKCRDAFDEALRKFKENVIRVAKSSDRRKKEETKTAENVEPKRLDPVEVLKSLPKELRKGFEVQDVKMVEDALDDLSDSEAQYHMQRCVDSGLWVPSGRNIMERY